MNVKVIISLVLCLSLLGGLFIFAQSEKKQDDFGMEFLRIHIRANSNDAADQDVKYEVKDKVVQYLTPFLCNATNKSAAIQIVNSKIEDIQKVADNVLKEHGFCYKSKGELKKETFPTRTYDNLTLPAGVYDSFILNLGEGAGNNWWCVVYPPLCFVNNDNSTNVVYKSKLIDIINSFWRRTNAN